MTDGRALLPWDLDVLPKLPTMELWYLQNLVDQVSHAKFYEMEIIRFFTSLRIQTVIQRLATNKYHHLESKDPRPMVTQAIQNTSPSASSR